MPARGSTRQCSGRSLTTGWLIASGAVALVVLPVQAQEPAPGYRVHEVGFLDLNRAGGVQGWLATLPPDAPVISFARPAAAEAASTGLQSGGTGSAGVKNAPATGGGTGSVSPTSGDSGGGTRGGGSATPTPTGPVPTPTGTGNETRPEPPGPGGRGVPGGFGGCDPFLFFHAERACTVSVEVGVTGGLPLAWMPDARAEARTLRFEQVRVDPGLAAPTAGELRVARWPGLQPLAHFRDAAGTAVRMGDRVEAGLAYEGALPFPLGLEVRRAGDTLTIRNTSGIALHAVCVLGPGATTHAVVLGTVAAGETRTLALAPAAEDLTPLADALEMDLEARGLEAAEATALRRTVCDRELTHGTGVRLVARLPRAVWDAAFPLRLDPAPTALVRVGLVRIFDAETYVHGPATDVPLPAGAERAVRRGVPAAGASLAGQ